MPGFSAVAAGSPDPDRAPVGVSAPEPPARTCDGCSACCEEQGLPPGYSIPKLLTFLPEALRDEIALHQHEEKATGWTRHERGLPCIWLDLGTGRCQHYEVRPRACRVFPVGGDGCTFWRTRRPPGREDLLAARQPAEPLMTADLRSDGDDAILACEADLRAAMLDGDADALEGLLDDALVFTALDGRVLGKAEDLDAHRSGRLRLTRLDPSDCRVVRFGATAVVSVRMDVEATVDGRRADGAFRYTRVWCERPAGWRVVAGHMSAVES